MAEGDITDKSKKQGRVLGWGLVALGILSIMDSFSPVPIPTVGITAIISGILFALAGGVILLNDKIPFLKLLRGKFTQVIKAPPPVKIDPLLPVRILKLARERGGVLTLAEVSIELGLPLEEAEAGMEACIRHGHVTSDFDMAKEITYYRFQEFIERLPEE